VRPGSPHLTATDFYALYRPSTCEKRVFLLAHETPPGEPGELEGIMRELGERHEKAHLETFAQVRDLGDGNLSDRAQRTREAVRSGAAVIYQGVLRAALPGSQQAIIGVPDFMIRRDDSYAVRDCKLARSAGESSHPEIFHQLQTYGWLFERTFGRPPVALEAYLGDGTLAAIPYLGAERAEKDLSRLRELSLLAGEPWEPVGWSKCSACPFHERCWSRAAESHDVSLVYGLDQGLARALRDKGILTYDALAAQMDAERLAALTRRRGRSDQKVGAAASRILSQAQALAAGKVIRLGRLEIPPGAVVMLDLEGMPPQNEELDRVYLWGMQLYQDEGPAGAATPAGPYEPAIAGFGPEGDRKAWEQFLESSKRILREHGGIPFIHWADYEKTKIRSYIERFGDRDGVASRVLDFCFDLLRAVRDSLALPVPSYGLKVIERLCGYTRTMEDYGGDWSIARYIRASESTDEAERSRIMEEIARYNEEDLQAMAAVLSWARSFSGTA
jgi:predicted RecB family nuclease